MGLRKCYFYDCQVAKHNYDEISFLGVYYLRNRLFLYLNLALRAVIFVLLGGEKWE